MSRLDMDMATDPVEFTEAVNGFSARRVITREEADALSDYAKRRAFWISGVAQMDVVNDAQESIAKAIADGVSFEDWQKEFGPKLEKAWGRKDSPRILTIFRNATTSAYNAGRLDQMDESHIRAVRPFKMLSVVDDERTCSFCGQFIEPPVVLPADDPWWITHSPPFHHCDRCGIRSLRRSVAEKKGIMERAPDVQVPDGWGTDPRVAEPPKPSERGAPPDPELQIECAIKAGKDYRERKSVKVPDSSIGVAKPGKIVPGVHVLDDDVAGKKLSRIRVTYRRRKPTPKETKNVLTALNTDELAVLENEPLNHLQISDEVCGGEATGVCGGVRGLKLDRKPQIRGSSGYIEISVQLTALEYDHPLVPGKIDTVDLAANTAEEAIQCVVVHEFGHLLHMRAPDEMFHSVKEDFAKGNPISEYAKVDEYEYFAESYLAYRKHGEELKAHDPVGYAMIRRFCRHYGIR